MERPCESKTNKTNFYILVSILVHTIILGVLICGYFFSDRTIAASGDNSIKAVMVDLSMVAAPQQSLVEEVLERNAVDVPEIPENNNLTETVAESEVKQDINSDIVVDKEVIDEIKFTKDAQLVVADKPQKKQQKESPPVKKTSIPQVKQEVLAEKIADTVVAPSISANTQFSATPTAISRSNPEYPRRALDMRIEGYVVAVFDVNNHGRVENIRVIESKPNSIFNQTVIKAMRQWKYQKISARDLTVKIVFNRNKTIKLNNI